MSKLKWRKVSGKDEWRASHELGRFVIYKDETGAHPAVFRPENKSNQTWTVVEHEDYCDSPDFADLNFAKARCQAFIDCKLAMDVHKYYNLENKLTVLENDYLKVYNDLMDNHDRFYEERDGYLTEKQEDQLAMAETDLENRYDNKREPLEQEAHDVWTNLDQKHLEFLDENQNMIQGMAAKQKMAVLLDEADATMADPIKRLERRREQLVKELIEIDKQLVGE